MDQAATGMDERTSGAALPRRAAPSASPRSQGDVRRANSWSLIEAVRAAGVASRSRLAADTGLNAMSVHRLVADLRHRKVLVPAGMAPGGTPGRPSSLFRFNASLGHVVGIDVGNETTRAVLADLDGTRHARVEIPTAEIETNLGPRLAGLVPELRSVARGRRGALVGMAVGVPAVAGPDGTIIRASQHHVWEGLPLGAYLRATTGSDVVVRQDDHLAALAELRGGACVGLGTAVVLDMGKGMGLGIIADGQVHGGLHNAAGRVSWIPVEPGHGAIPGDATAGVPLGDLLTADGLIADYRRLGGSATLDGARGVFLADAAGDPAARAAIDTFAERLGWLIGAIVAVLDPERVVIGGGISGSFGRLAPGVAERLGAIVPVPPPVVASMLGPEAVVTGAVDAALDLADAWLDSRLEA